MVVVRSLVLVWVFIVSILTAAGRGEAEGGGFALGVEYMVPGLAEVYAKTGVTWAKPMARGFSWGDIEPEPPVGGKTITIGSKQIG
ncbi:MAG: hypothetical protein QHH07_10075 [Sedimentisphaerales bacterium]|nr:hypothetical protein [Sedimentisphaerales bacterium]